MIDFIDFFFFWNLGGRSTFLKIKKVKMQKFLIFFRDFIKKLDFTFSIEKILLVRPGKVLLSVLFIRDLNSTYYI